MTLSYSHLVFTSRGFGTFLKLLFKWKGSIYKLVWMELLVYMMLYTILALIYRLALDEESKKYFENVCLYCGNHGNQIPITFVLGFYVSLIITRWWNQFESIPWPDTASLWVSTCIHGQDERGRLMRRTIVRYLNLALIMVFRLICLPVKKRFPTLDHLLVAGILEENEKQIIAAMEKKANQRSFWMPLVWAGSIVIRARKEDRVKNDQTVQALITQITEFRSKAGKLLHYDWVPVPLVYTQVVTLAVYSYLLSALFGRQFLDPEKKYPGHEVDLYVPIFSFLQFFFYMGWLKVAEALINPFGEDDDDFEANWIIDRNLCVSYLIVDEMHSDHPDLVKDQFWDEQYPELPYTAASEETKSSDPCVGSTANVEVPEDLGYFVDDLRVIVTDEKGPLLSDDEEEAKQARRRSSAHGSRSTLNGAHLKQAEGPAPTFIDKIGNALSGSRSFLGSNLSIFSKPNRTRPQRRLSRMSNRQVSVASLAHHEEAVEKSPEPGQQFPFDRNFSYDTDITGSETNIPRVQTPPISGENKEFLASPKLSGRLWRRMSEPVNDLPKRRTKKRSPVYVRQQSLSNSNNNNNQKELLQKVEMLHSFTQETLNAMKQDGGASRLENKHDSAELLKILDETHQQFRNHLLKGAQRKRLPGSTGSFGNRESPAHSDHDMEFDPKTRKMEIPIKKFGKEGLTPTDEMLIFKIDHASDSVDSLEGEPDEAAPDLKTITSSQGLKESRSTPMLELQAKELEIIEEQNEQDNNSDTGEATSLLQEDMTSKQTLGLTLSPSGSVKNIKDH